MATGASTADAAIILIDARHELYRRNGMRHRLLLKIRHLIVAVNRWIFWITLKKNSGRLKKNSEASRNS
ncbi:MAG: hypothetical protein ACLT38_08810 [Akkermansia sp.]